MSDTITQNSITLEFDDSEEVTRQQDAVEVAEMKAGEIISGGWLQSGYFDDANADASLAEDSERFARMMIDKTSASAGQTFCDLGCGVGSSAIVLALGKWKQVHPEVNMVAIWQHTSTRNSLPTNCSGTP